MRQTLVLIPHELAGLPVFGFGWLLIGLAVALVVRIALAKRFGQPIGPFLVTEGLMWGLGAVIIAIVLPSVELTNVAGEPVGMAIRGYGMMLLCGVASAVALAASRARRRGLDPDIIYSLAPWAFIGGIGGARLFYVIQYRDKFETIADMFKFTEGGLVVYGSFIGGSVAVIYYIYRHQLPLLKLGDVIVPCLFIGVFFGRIGCLMNGCCYGGRCEDHWAAVKFPPATQVYHEQVLKSGELLGLDFDQQTFRVKTVSQGSLAAQAGIQPGSMIQSIRYGTAELTEASRVIPADDVRRDVIAKIDGKEYRWTPEQLPDRALPVYAVQLLSSISSLILCLALCGLSLFVKREGAIMMIGFAAYAVVRFMLEMIRVDEGGQFGTNLSISQWVSVVVFAICLIGLVFVYRRPSSNETVQAQPSAG